MRTKPESITYHTKEEEKGMDSDNRHRGGAGAAGVGGVFWFAGWLFTIAFANLVWWKIILGIVVWPYFLGLAIK